MNILLACNGGISTSLIADKIMDAAKERGMNDVKAWAVDDGAIAEELEKNKVDVVLLGPQIRFKLKKIQNSFADKNIPIDCMNPMDYGMNDGKKILNFAIKKIQGE